MRTNRVLSVFTASQTGMSLTELALVMLIVSLALVPMVKMIGGPSSENGNAALVSGTKNKEAILANAMVNKVLAGDYSSLNCVGGNPVALSNYDALFPTDGNPRMFSPCKEASGATPLYYQWEVMQMTKANNGRELPENNRYYQATLNVLEKTGSRYSPIFTMPVNFFRNEGQINNDAKPTGVMIAMDRSGSMGWSDKNFNLPAVWGFTAPYMYYRYDKNLFTSGGSSWDNFASIKPSSKYDLNMWDNSQLDMVYGKDYPVGGLNKGEDPDSGTPNNEAFPMAVASASGSHNPGVFGDGLLGTGDCSTTNNGQWNGADKSLAYTFLDIARSNVQVEDFETRKIGLKVRLRSEVLIPLCERKANYNDWFNTIKTKLSRYEAARTAMLALLLKLEDKPSVSSVIEVGFFPWGSYPAVAEYGKQNYEVKLSGTKPNPEKPSEMVFDKLRQQLLWINRADPSNTNSGRSIRLEGGTNIHLALAQAKQRLLANDYDRKIVVLLTDGEPSPNFGVNSNDKNGGLRKYVNDNYGCGVANKNERITLFAVGLIAADNDLMGDMADSTPDGQYFEATDVSKLSPIFDTIAYQIQRLALLDIAKRYQLDLAETDTCS